LQSAQIDNGNPQAIAFCFKKGDETITRFMESDSLLSAIEEYNKKYITSARPDHSIV
jgi:hypothetical protein